MAKGVINHTCMTICVSYFHHSNMLHWDKSLSFITLFVTHLTQEIEIHHQVWLKKKLNNASDDLHFFLASLCMWYQAFQSSLCLNQLLGNCLYIWTLSIINILDPQVKRPIKIVNLGYFHMWRQQSNGKSYNLLKILAWNQNAHNFQMLIRL